MNTTPALEKHVLDSEVFRTLSSSELPGVNAECTQNSDTSQKPEEPGRPGIICVPAPDTVRTMSLSAPQSRCLIRHKHPKNCRDFQKDNFHL